MKKNQHVVPSGDQWAVRGEVIVKDKNYPNSKRKAIEIARTIAWKEQSDKNSRKMVVLDKR